MQKVLTISVAAYNVEKFIEKALNSLMFEGFEEKLEVFVVDDGGKDGTLEIAKQFQERFPNTFYAVHKENGGYGSTVNYSIEHATGKYFKLLDGDDYYDTDALKKLVEKLEKVDADVVAMPMWKGIPEEGMTRLEVGADRPDGVLKISGMGEQKMVIGHHSSVFKTSILRNCGLRLPERTLYTDAIFCIEPFAIAETILFFQEAVYCYRMGRDEQSVSMKSKLRHLEELKTIALRLTRFYEEHAQHPNAAYIKRYVAQNACIVMKVMLHAKVCKDSFKDIKAFDCSIKDLSADVYKDSVWVSKVGRLMGLIRASKYTLYWPVAALLNIE